jgi:hypothetical protein
MRLVPRAGMISLLPLGPASYESDAGGDSKQNTGRTVQRLHQEGRGPQEFRLVMY